MLTTYTRTHNSWTADMPGIVAGLADAAIWVDLLNPSPDEDRFLESQLGIEVPTREDMRDIEPSSRLYTENGVCVMTASLVVGADSPKPTISPVTFILTPNRFCTLRYDEPSALARFSGRFLRQPNNLCLAEDVFLTMMDVIVDRLAEVLENYGHSLDMLSADVFANNDDDSDANTLMSPKAHDLQSTLKKLGAIGNTVSIARESLVSVARLLSFVGPAAESWLKGESQSHIKTLLRDARFLTEHADSINVKINFLLDATLGLINIQQSNTVKILSVASVVFLPPTLIASVFGMNFHNIPGLDSQWGFAIVLLSIFLAGAIPYWMFNRKGM